MKLRASPGKEPTYPKIASFDRSLGIYDFEGGGFVQIVVGGEVDTAEALDMVDTLVRLKRDELVMDPKDQLRGALREIDAIAAEMGHPDTLGFHEARERILEITMPLVGIQKVVPSLSNEHAPLNETATDGSKTHDVDTSA